MNELDDFLFCACYYLESCCWLVFVGPRLDYQTKTPGIIYVGFSGLGMVWMEEVDVRRTRVGHEMSVNCVELVYNSSGSVRLPLTFELWTCRRPCLCITDNR